MVLTSKHGGLHHGTVFVACAIVAGNVWNGDFIHERDGGDLQLGHDDILSERSYYFHVPSPAAEVYKYLIYPSFEYWSFPHRDLPLAWSVFASAENTESNDDGSTLAPPSASKLTSAILRRDGCCRVLLGDWAERLRRDCAPVSLKRSLMV
jgi:hypothetical protein